MSEFLSAIAKLSSAEDFMTFLEIDHDPKVISVNRLHILKRFHNYLAQAGLPKAEMSDEALKLAYRGWLEKACDDFTRETGVGAKLFKVFKDAENEQKAGGRGQFVPLTSLSRNVAADPAG